MPKQTVDELKKKRQGLRNGDTAMHQQTPKKDFVE